MNYGGHLVLINIVLCMRCNYLKLNTYYQAFKSSFYSKKVNLCTFLLKRKDGILDFNGHVTYDLPMTPKILLSSKWHYGILKPELRAKKHISKIVRTEFIADYFFLATILEKCKLAN